MAINFSQGVYTPVQSVFAVPVTVHLQSGESYVNRGVYGLRELDVIAEDGSTFSDHESILDIRTAEFPIPPVQNDRISIPFDCNGEPLGEFEVVKTSLNGGGQMTLVLRKWEQPRT